MKSIFLIPVLLSVALSSACQSSGGEKGATEITEDSAYIASHGTPEPLSFQGKGEMITFPTPDGKTGSAYSLKAATDTKNYLLVFQEWWGLNDYIKREAERLAAELGNVNVLALDMYDGKVTDKSEEARKFKGEMSDERGIAIVRGAIDYAGKDAKIATIGWCFGGAWSLRAAIEAGDQGIACVIYYGSPVERADELAPIKAPILGIFGKQDTGINETVVGKFEALAKATGKDLQVQWYDAPHAFANPSSPRYNEKAAAEANALALEFLKTHVK